HHCWGSSTSTAVLVWWPCSTPATRPGWSPWWWVPGRGGHDHDGFRQPGVRGSLSGWPGESEHLGSDGFHDPSVADGGRHQPPGAVGTRPDGQGNSRRQGHSVPPVRLGSSLSRGEVGLNSRVWANTTRVTRLISGMWSPSSAKTGRRPN